MPSGQLPVDCRLASLGQDSESSAYLVRLRDLQRFAEPQGPLPGHPRLLIAANRAQGIAKVPERLGLAMAVAQFPEDGEAFMQAGERFLGSPELPVHHAKAFEAGGLVAAVAQLPEDGQAVLLAGDRLRIPLQPLIDDAEAVQAVGLAVAVAQLPEDGLAVLLAGDRLVIPPLQAVNVAEAA